MCHECIFDRQLSPLSAKNSFTAEFGGEIGKVDYR